jgi:hypothetical protein
MRRTWLDRQEHHRQNLIWSQDAPFARAFLTPPHPALPLPSTERGKHLQSLHRRRSISCAFLHSLTSKPPAYRYASYGARIELNHSVLLQVVRNPKRQHRLPSWLPISLILAAQNGQMSQLTTPPTRLFVSKKRHNHRLTF